MSDETRFQAASDRSLLIYLGNEISLDLHQRVRKLLHLLQREPLLAIHNLHPAYCSLLITFDPLNLTHAKLQAVLELHLDRLDEFSLPAPRQIEIPVCYDQEFGPDLSHVATLHNITTDEVITLHSSAHYDVYFLGFVPGFAYLGGLPETLATPRLPTPRREVPRGSVGIAGNQTGIYPFATPGGWRLIGRTPVKMFAPERKEMSFVAIGDRVRFAPISREQFEKMENS